MQPTSWRLLMVDDDAEDYLLTRALLRDVHNLRVQVDYAETVSAGRAAMQSTVYDAVLVDYDLGLENGLTLIREMSANGNRVPMLLVTGRGSYEVDVQAMEAGAADYLNKNQLTTTVLERAIRYAIERQRSAEALRLSEEKIHRVINTSADGILLADENGLLLEWNASRAHMTGLEREQVLGRPLAAYLAGDVDAAQLANLAATGQPYELRFSERVLHPQRGERLLETVAFPIRTENGFQVGAISRDITELEQARREAEALARFPGENPNPVVRISGDGTLLYANPASAALLGQLHFQVGRPVPDEWREKVQNSLASGQKLEFDVPNDGEVFHVIITPIGEHQYVNLYAINITGRLETEADLLRERELLQAIFDRIPVMISIYRPNLDMTQFNKEFERRLGFRSEDTRGGQNLMERFYPDEAYRREVSEFMTSLVEGWRDFTVTAKDGSEVESSWSNVRLSDDTQIGIGIDISDRKAAERAMEEAHRQLKYQARELALTNQHLSGLFEHSPTGLALFDAHPPFRVIMHNRVYQEIFPEPYHHEGMDERPLTEFLPAEGAQPVLEIFEQVSSTRQAQTFYNFRFEGLPQGTTWWNWHLSPVIVDGEVVALAHSAVDVTSQNLALQQLQQELEERKKADARLQKLLNAITDCYLRLDKDWRFVEINPATEAFLGRKAEEMLGGVLWDLFPGIEKTKLGKAYVQAAETGQVQHLEHSSITVDRWSDVKIYPQDDGLAVYFTDITARKKSEQSLQESQERFRQLVENNPLPILLIDSAGQICQANPSFFDLVGFSQDDLTEGRLRWDALTPPEYASLDVEHLAEAVERGSCNPYEKEFLHKDGSRIPVWIAYSHLPGERDEFVCHALDLRPRRQASESLRRYAEHFRLAQQAGQIATWELDREGGQHYIADNCFQMFNIDPAAPDIFDAWWDGVHPDDRPVLQAKEAHCIAEGSATAEYRYRSPANPEDEHWILTQAAIVTRGDGRRVMAQVNFDITEQKRTLEALRSSEQQFRLMGESVDYGVWLCDAQGKTIYLSQSFLDLIDMTMEESQNYTWTSRLPPDEVEPMIESWMNCLRTGADWDGEHHILGPDGKYHTVLTRGKPVRDEYGHITHWVGINLDITDRKRIESHSAFLADLGDHLLGMRDEQEVIGHVMESIRAHLQAGGCILDEEDPTNTAYHRIHTHKGKFGVVPEQFPLTSVPPMFIESLSRGETVVVNDSSTDPRTAAFYDVQFGPHGADAVLIIPRFKDGRWVGSLTINHPQPRRWLPDEIETASSAADLVWLAVESARAYQSLKTVEERLRIGLANAPITVFTQDCDLRYTWVYNPDIDMSGVVGRHDSEIFPDSDAQEMVEFKQQVLDSGQTQRGEVKVRYQGQEHHVMLSIEPMRDEQGNRIGLTGSSMDITDLRRLEAFRTEQMTHLSVQRQLMQQREMERLEIARELHDGPLQELIAVSFTMQDAVQTDDRLQRMEKHRLIQEAIHRQIVEIRRFCNELRPPALAPFGLEKAIRSYADEFRRRFPATQLALDLMPDGNRLPEAARLAMYRIFQEQMNNIRKHSGASQVHVLLEVTDEDVTLEVRDNGCGFSVPENWMEFAHAGHLGLVGMRERAEAAGGHITLSSQPGIGTRLRVCVPLAAGL